MWIVAWLRPNIPKWNKAYFVSKNEAYRFYRIKTYNNGMNVTIHYDDSFELEPWEKRHR